MFHLLSQTDSALVVLGEKLMSFIGTAIAWKRHISPLLYDTVKFTRSPDTTPFTLLTETPITETPATGE